MVIFEKRGVNRSLSGLLKLWKELCKRRFDLVINYQRSNLYLECMKRITVDQILLEIVVMLAEKGEWPYGS